MATAPLKMYPLASIGCSIISYFHRSCFVFPITVHFLPYLFVTRQNTCCGNQTVNFTVISLSVISLYDRFLLAGSLQQYNNILKFCIVRDAEPGRKQICS